MNGRFADEVRTTRTGVVRLRIDQISHDSAPPPPEAVGNAAAPPPDRLKPGQLGRQASESEAVADSRNRMSSQPSRAEQPVAASCHVQRDSPCTDMDSRVAVFLREHSAFIGNRSLTDPGRPRATPWTTLPAFCTWSVCGTPPRLHCCCSPSGPPAPPRLFRPFSWQGRSLRIGIAPQSWTSCSGPRSLAEASQRPGTGAVTERPLLAHRGDGSLWPRNKNPSTAAENDGGGYG